MRQRRVRFPLIANWGDKGTLDCLRDDGYDSETVADLANPQGVLLFDLEPPTVETLLKNALDEYLDTYGDDDKPSGQWNTDGWEPSTGPNHMGQQTWWWGDADEPCRVVVTAREAHTYGRGPA